MKMFKMENNTLFGNGPVVTIFFCISASLSALSLINIYIEIGYYELISELIRRYDNLLSGIFLPINIVLLYFIERISNFLEIKITLQKYWYHYFVLVSFYNYPPIVAYKKFCKKISIYFFSILSLFTALLAGILAGAIPFAKSGFVANLMVYLIPIFCIYLFQTGVHLWRRSFDLSEFYTDKNLFFKHQQSQVLLLILGYSTVAIALLFYDQVNSFPGSGVLLFYGFTIVAMIYGFTKGLYDAMQRRQEDNSFWYTYINTGNTYSAKIFFLVYAIVFSILIFGSNIFEKLSL